MAINTTVLNTGDSATLKSLISCYVDDEKIASQELPQIDAGKSWSGSFNWVAESGPHTIKITADPNDNIVEIDETNNEKETEFSAMTPDLIIQDISWMTDESLESNEVKLTITVKNTGMGDAGACQLMYLLDLEPEVYKDIPAIPAGGSSNLTVTAILSAGTHSLEATANCYEEATELDYDNNEKTITFSTVVPDLVVRTINWSPLNAKIGDTVTISVKVENRGKAKAKDVSLALSVDGTSIGSANITELDANSLDTVDFSWTVMEGQHEFSVLTDAGQTIAESNEINNTKSLTLSFETPKPTARRTTNVAAFSPADSGFSSSWWWILLLVAALIGIAFFVTILRNMRKKY